MIDPYYTDKAKAYDSHLYPEVTVMPLFDYTTIGNNFATERTRFEITARGQDGSFSRSYTDITNWSKSV